MVPERITTADWGCWGELDGLLDVDIGELKALLDEDLLGELGADGGMILRGEVSVSIGTGDTGGDELGGLLRREAPEESDGDECGGLLGLFMSCIFDGEFTFGVS